MSMNWIGHLKAILLTLVVVWTLAGTSYFGSDQVNLDFYCGNYHNSYQGDSSNRSFEIEIFCGEGENLARPVKVTNGQTYEELYKGVNFAGVGLLSIIIAKNKHICITLVSSLKIVFWSVLYWELGIFEFQGDADIKFNFRRSFKFYFLIIWNVGCLFFAFCFKFLVNITKKKAEVELLETSDKRISEEEV